MSTIITLLGGGLAGATLNQIASLYISKKKEKKRIFKKQKFLNDILIDTFKPSIERLINNYNNLKPIIADVKDTPVFTEEVFFIVDLFDFINKDDSIIICENRKIDVNDLYELNICLQTIKAYSPKEIINEFNTGMDELRNFTATSYWNIEANNYEELFSERLSGKFEKNEIEQQSLIRETISKDIELVIDKCKKAIEIIDKICKNLSK